jgi:hypothetical protein
MQSPVNTPAGRPASIIPSMLDKTLSTQVPIYYRELFWNPFVIRCQGKQYLDRARFHDLRNTESIHPMRRRRILAVSCMVGINWWKCPPP